MKICKVGEKVIINGRVATVESRPAQASGMQTIHYDKVPGFWGFEWWEKKALAKFPRVSSEEATG